LKLYFRFLSSFGLELRISVLLLIDRLLAHANRWMRAKKLPFSIREQVEIFYEAKLSGSERKVVDQTVIIADLQPAPMANELVQILYSDIIERVPIFSRLDDEVIVKLCMLLQPIPALRGSPGGC
jgi:hypothetical protein